MSEIINLRQARKDRGRKQKEAQAESNRAKFGRTKAQKHKDKTVADKLQRHLDGHKLQSQANDETPSDT